MAKVVIFSGAGISAESGISTFRDSGGLWDNYNIEDVCYFDSLQKNRQLVIDFYDKRRTELEDKKPNKAHIEIAKLQQKYPKDIKIITQNVDDMFERAGCKDVLHVHGFLRELRCEQCSYIKDIGYRKQNDDIDICPEHNLPLRPNIVFFGESAPCYKDMYKEVEQCELFVCIGTSGDVVDVNFLAAYAKKAILNNLEPSRAIYKDRFDSIYYEPATKAIDKIVKEVEEFLSKD